MSFRPWHRVSGEVAIQGQGDLWHRLILVLAKIRPASPEQRRPHPKTS